VLRRVAVVGASQAGLSAVRALRKEGFDGTLRLIGAESRPPYQRPPLSKQVLAGVWGPERTDLGFDDSLETELILANPAVGLDLGRRRLQLAQGPPVDFDGLVIATGASPRPLPGLPAGLSGLHYLRTVEDCLAIRAELAGGPRVVIIGAGFIGSEVASTCRSLGLEVTVLEALPAPLERALGPAMGAALGELHRDHGVDLRLSTAVEAVVGRGRVEGVRLAGGELLPADLVVVGVGVAPGTGWLESSGLRLDDGVVCDRTCAAAPGVVAAGDVARWDHVLFGLGLRVEHWDNAVGQGEAAAATLLAGPEGARPYAPVPFFWSDQYDTKIQFVGTTTPDVSVEVVEGSVPERRFVATYRRAGTLVGALLVGSPHRMPAYRKMVAERHSLTAA